MSGDFWLGVMVGMGGLILPGLLVVFLAWRNAPVVDDADEWGV